MTRTASVEGRPSGRYASIDLLRIAAAFGIVCFHSRIEGSDFRDVFYSGLVCFIIISVVLALRPTGRTLADHIRNARRVALPWAFWSAVFLAREYYTDPEFAPGPLSLIGKVLSGASLHLWYLPFIIAVTISLSLLHRVMSLQSLRIVAALGLILLGATDEVWRPWSLSLPAPWPQYVHALFPVLAGVIVAAERSGWIIPGTLVVIASALSLFDEKGLGLPYLIGFVLAFAAFRLRDRIRIESPMLRLLADSMFGVYLIHPLFFYPCRLLVPEGGLLHPLAVFCLSTVVVLLASKGGPVIRALFGFPPREKETLAERADRGAA